jgi:taurine dioxygenase
VRIDAAQVKDYNRIRVEPVTGSIGAEVIDIDLRQIDGEIVDELHDAWMAHKVLFFRDQELTHQQHVDYGRAFGELEVHPFIPAPDGHPEIVVLESTPDAFEAAEFWHNDVTFRPTPPMGSILLGRVVPPYGGDTSWANMELAYDLLPDDLKELLEGATAAHSYIKAFGRGLSDEQKAAKQLENPDQTHPVVRTHPVTGAKSLFINRSFTLSMHVDGLDEEQSRTLRHRLYDQARIPEIQCRFRWRPGSIAQWDNRCTQHYAIPDYGGFSRRVERVTLAGDRPF